MLGGVVVIATTVNDDGDIVRLAPPASLTIGEQDGRTSARLTEIEAVLDRRRIRLHRAADITAQMWAKWVFISTVSGLTCLMRGPVGDIVAVPGGGDLGPAFSPKERPSPMPPASRCLRSGRPASARVTPRAHHHVLDVSRYRGGHPTEVEHIFGDLVAKARALSVATPLLDLATMHLRVHQRRSGN